MLSFLLAASHELWDSDLTKVRSDSMSLRHFNLKSVLVPTPSSLSCLCNDLPPCLTSFFASKAAAATDLLYSSECLCWCLVAGSWMLACLVCPSGPSESFEHYLHARFLLACSVHVLSPGLFAPVVVEGMYSIPHFHLYFLDIRVILKVSSLS